LLFVLGLGSVQKVPEPQKLAGIVSPPKENAGWVAAIPLSHTKFTCAAFLEIDFGHEAELL
jgi:hypothetical protein